VIEVVVSFVLGAVLGCAAAILWIRSVLRDPAKLAQFAGLSGIDPHEAMSLLLGKKEER